MTLRGFATFPATPTVTHSLRFRQAVLAPNAVHRRGAR